MFVNKEYLQRRHVQFVTIFKQIMLLHFYRNYIYVHNLNHNL